MKSICKWFLILTLCTTPFFIYSYEVAIATMFHNEGPYLKEWIDYHRMIGVDHFWMYNDRSSDDWQEILSPYIEEGLVEVFEWPIPCREEYTATQCLAFRDALKRGLGKSKWVACVDLDEFILPLIGSSLPECLEKKFKEAGAVYANWRCFGTGGVYVPEGQPILFYLTASSLKSHPRNCVGKSIIRPEAARIEDLWYPHTCPLKAGMKYLNGDGGEMPLAEGTDIKTDGKGHTKWIRINHYVMRDEDYFQNVRLERARNGYSGYSLSDLPLLIAQNEQFSLVKDYTLINFIKKNYPESSKFWEQSKDLNTGNIDD